MSPTSHADRASRGAFALALRHAVILSLTCGLAASLLLGAATRWMTPAAVSGSIGDAGWTGRTRAWFTTRGFLGAEVDIGSGQQFSWTSSRARLTIPNLPRSIPYTLSFQVRAFRLAERPPPTVTISVDGRAAASMPTSTDAQWISAAIPASAGAGVLVTIDASDTFVPGAGDARALGVMVNDVSLAPVDARFRPSWMVSGLAALAAAAFVLGFTLCGVPRAITTLLAAATVAGLVWLLLLDAAFLGHDVWRLVQIGTGAALIGLVVFALRAQWPTVAGLPEWSAAVGIVLGLSALKLAFFTHPQIAMTDAFFQVHRAQLVERGTYFFTSVTPSPSFEFPYAILLYLTALPLWSWFPSELQIANLLRGLALGADALVGVGLYAVTRRQWQHGGVALLCAGLWTVARAPAMALGHANLTNLFGQGLFGVATCMVAWMAVGRRASVPALAATGLVTTLAFLSHFSTLSIGILLLSAVIGACLVVGDRALRIVALKVAVMLAAAVAVAYALYYSHFTELYQQTFTRIVSGVDAPSETSMVASPVLKFQRWITEDQFSNDYGLPGPALLVSSALGFAWLLQERRRDPLTIVLGAWAIVWIVATVLGIFTSVELRANLASAPMFVCLGAYGLWQIALRSTFGRVVAGVGTAAIVWAGLHVWLFWLV